MDIGFWLGAYLPAHAPSAAVTRLQQLLTGATKAAEVRRGIDLMRGTFEFLLSPAELAKFQARQSTDWGRIIRAAESSRSKTTAQPRPEPAVSPMT
jgi:tripartite-type tricarboxylate transporter receptor subunit TctC